MLLLLLLHLQSHWYPWTKMKTDTLTHCAFLFLFSYLHSNLFYVNIIWNAIQLFTHLPVWAFVWTLVCACVCWVCVHRMIIIMIMMAALSSIHSKYKRVLYKNKWNYELNWCAHECYSIHMHTHTKMPSKAYMSAAKQMEANKWMVNMQSKFITTEMKMLRLCVWTQINEPISKLFDYQHRVS